MLVAAVRDSARCRRVERTTWLHRAGWIGWAVIRIGAQVSLSAIDVRTLAAVLPALARRWRGLRFEQGVYVSATGQRREGLRIEQGSHPRPGTRYLLMFDPAHSSEPQDEGVGDEPVPAKTLVELLADDIHRIRIRVRRVGGPDVVEAELRRPYRPEGITVDVAGTVPGGWPAGGPFAVEAGIAVDQMPPTQSRGPQLVVEARHGRAQGRADVAIREADAGFWTVDVAIRARGRGVARPMVAILTPFLRRYAQRGLDAFIGRLPEEIDQFNQELREEFGPSPDPEQVADKVLNDLLAGVAEYVA